MPIGPGKYGDICTFVMKETEARSVILIVIDGKDGNGFSVQSELALPPNVLANLLDDVADELRKS
jgi:hypothetical protein